MTTQEKYQLKNYCFAVISFLIAAFLLIIPLRLFISADARQWFVLWFFMGSWFARDDMPEWQRWIASPMVGLGRFIRFQILDKIFS